MSKLARELSNYVGARVSADRFREMIVDEAASSVVEDWTGDELLCHPFEAMQFCNRVRDQVYGKLIPDALILRTFLNIRKKGGGEVNLADGD